MKNSAEGGKKSVRQLLPQDRQRQSDDVVKKARLGPANGERDQNAGASSLELDVLFPDLRGRIAEAIRIVLAERDGML